jgi:hypothetical protein
VSVNCSSAFTVSPVTSGTHSAAASCSLKIGIPAATSDSSAAGTSSNATDWWPMSKTTPRCLRTRPIASDTGTRASRANSSAPEREKTCSSK